MLCSNRAVQDWAGKLQHFDFRYRMLCCSAISVFACSHLRPWQKRCVCRSSCPLKLSLLQWTKVEERSGSWMSACLGHWGKYRCLVWCALLQVPHSFLVKYSNIKYAVLGFFIRNCSGCLISQMLLLRLGINPHWFLPGGLAGGVGHMYFVLFCLCSLLKCKHSGFSSVKLVWVVCGSAQTQILKLW